ncbi:hypothetical protein DEU56DRAFT_19247 [Suillus clintonianus]|uniref:uncharacterized protein n=1 Tax=Suillus clintonianus TaxID=1904413 RepID=UPI001B8674A5|nr:uncharacterized protein DEU56DRAFT_19247 [Suillus clintonianus]KAG2157414.1 hypothetical protein DEU56DRAFT_19247 [Suillus clintonianus]
MSAEPVDLCTMARSKLHSAMGGSLHRWVLLKNSAYRPPRAPYVPSVATSSSYSKHVYISSDDGDNEDDSEEELDSFMFPDGSKLVGVGANSSEAEWLDSLLESLVEGGDDECASDVDVRVSILPVEDDEDPPLSPLTSPMSSSDDLLSHQAYFSPPIAVPYPVPYPPFHPPLVRPYEIDPIIESPVSPFPAYDALPYFDADELDDLSVPEAIEDTSDDESDALSTPSLGRSSDLDFVDPTSLAVRSRRRSQPHVYIRHPDSYFDRYALDPLPFPDEDHSTSYNAVYHEC